MNMNSIQSQVFVTPLPPMSIFPWQAPPAPDTDVFIPGLPKSVPISFPSSPLGSGRIFLPAPKGARFLGDPVVKTIPAILPSADTGHPFAGDRQDPYAKLHLAGKTDEPLWEDRAARWFSEWVLKCGILSDDDFDAVLYSTILKMGGNFTFGTLGQALFAERGWHFVKGYRVEGRLVEWCTRGILLRKEDKISFSLMDAGARRIVYDYIRANPVRAEILRLVEAPKQEKVPEEIRPTLAELVARQEAILERLKALEAHEDRRIRDLAGRLKKRVMERSALMPQRIEDLSRQLRNLDEAARHSERVLVTVERPPRDDLGHATEPREKDPLVPAEDMETYFIAIDAMLGRILRAGRNGNSELASIEERYLEWLDGKPARQSELRAAIKALRRIEYELCAQPRIAGNSEETVPAEVDEPPVIQVDWSTFPRLLKPREALNILMRNGFQAVSGGPSSGSHLSFVHPRLEDKFMISVSAKLYTEERLARNVRAALKALSEEGIEVKW